MICKAITVHCLLMTMDFRILPRTTIIFPYSVHNLTIIVVSPSDRQDDAPYTPPPTVSKLSLLSRVADGPELGDGFRGTHSKDRRGGAIEEGRGICFSFAPPP